MHFVGQEDHKEEDSITHAESERQWCSRHRTEYLWM